MAKNYKEKMARCVSMTGKLGVTLRKLRQMHVRAAEAHELVPNGPERAAINAIRDGLAGMIAAIDAEIKKEKRQ